MNTSVTARSNFTIAKRTTLGFSAMFAITFGLGVLAFFNFLKVQTQANYLASDPVPGTIAMLKIDATLQEKLSLALALVNSTAGKDEIEKRLASSDASLAKLKQDYDVSISAAEDRAMFDIFIKAYAEFAPVFKGVISLSAAGKTAEAQAASKDMLLAFNKLDEPLTKLTVYNEGVIRRATGDIQSSISSAKSNLAWGLGAALLVGCVMAWLIIRAINRTLTAVTSSLAASAEQTSAAAAQVSGSSQSLAEGANQ